MKTRIGVPADRLEALRDFVGQTQIPVEVTSSEDCMVRVVDDPRLPPSDFERLYPGGSMHCATARGVAAKLNLDSKEFGKLLDFLNIKVRKCELGLFE